jgi:hypothetical protein
MLSEKLHRVDGKSPMANAELTRSAKRLPSGRTAFSLPTALLILIASPSGASPKFRRLCESGVQTWTFFTGATTPIRLLMWSFYCLCGQPGVAILANERDAFVHRVYAMRDFKIDLACEFVAFLEHRAVSPFNEFGPHFSYENQGRVIKLADLEELPCE